ncbi:hypothetical protein CDAR_509911 [Caerostris darwini]|uniref:Uncharacterized protein n=1 Tax=Caerostris darwini TaxID=1538125 RepID=A0AAV4TSA6_9ARAC|nr:hypothetical protein CDAR_509911 [Caerostris darwini]
MTIPHPVKISTRCTDSASMRLCSRRWFSSSPLVSTFSPLTIHSHSCLLSVRSVFPTVQRIALNVSDSLTDKENQLFLVRESRHFFFQNRVSTNRCAG